MKSRESLLRLKRFQVEEKRRQVAQIELMIGEFDRMAVELDNQIELEEKKANITDVDHFAYPTFAKAARNRRDNLQGSVNELRDQLGAANDALSEAETELEKAEMLEERDGGKSKTDQSAETARRELAERQAMIG